MRKEDSNKYGSRPRRLYCIEGPDLGRGDITVYVRLDEFRSDDEWILSRDRLRQVVRKQLLAEATFVTLGTTNFFDVWRSIIPTAEPDYWITAGVRSGKASKTKSPIIQIPVCLPSDKGAIEVCEAIFFALEALPIARSLAAIPRDRAVFSLTALSALSIAVRHRM